MAICDILVCLDATTAGDGRLDLALNLAQANKAYLTAVYALPERDGSAAAPAGAGLPPTVLGPVSPDGARAIGGLPTGTSAQAAQALRDRERADTAERRFREELEPRGLDGEWQMLGHGESPVLIRLAQAADLAIFGQYPGDDAHGVTWLRPDDELVKIGGPALVVPYAGSFASVGKRVLVAWDGTREANRALHDALSLIGGAETVTVMHVGTPAADFDRDRPWLERIVRHLARHGIMARPEESPRGDIAIADILLSRAADLAADMIVAGAYHHSHLRESLLGGVSRDLLDHMTVPVLMSH